jgi:DNA-binding response OmpR family regulator
MEKNVLLIDDEAALRRHVSMGLMQQGYHTEPCENGMKGLETLDTLMKRKMAPECAIVDIRLPDIDGLKLLKVIKSCYQHSTGSKEPEGRSISGKTLRNG